MSDVFVLTSSPETYGLVYLEAMASGCIVIGTQGWGIDGILVNGENGYLVEAKSVAEIVDALFIIFTNPQSIILNNSTKTVKNFTQEKAAANYAKCIKSCLN